MDIAYSNLYVITLCDMDFVKVSLCDMGKYHPSWYNAIFNEMHRVGYVNNPIEPD